LIDGLHLAKLGASNLSDFLGRRLPMPEKERKPEAAESTSLMERIVPVLELADRLGPVDPDIDQKALSDWICGDDKLLNEKW
jgi:hypothetical protein